MTQERAIGENTVHRMVLPQELHLIVIEAALAVNKSGLEQIQCLKTESRLGRDLDEDGNPVDRGFKVFTYQSEDLTPVFDRVVSQAFRVRKMAIDVFTLHRTKESETQGTHLSPGSIAVQAERDADAAARNSIRISITEATGTTQTA